jgi:hypothetical protein
MKKNNLLGLMFLCFVIVGFTIVLTEYKKHKRNERINKILEAQDKIADSLRRDKFIIEVFTNGWVHGAMAGMHGKDTFAEDSMQLRKILHSK